MESARGLTDASFHWGMILANMAGVSLALQVTRSSRLRAYSWSTPCSVLVTAKFRIIIKECIVKSIALLHTLY